jgi:hypothetical protein
MIIHIKGESVSQPEPEVFLGLLREDSKVFLVSEDAEEHRLYLAEVTQNGLALFPGITGGWNVNRGYIRVYRAGGEELVGREGVS